MMIVSMMNLGLIEVITDAECKTVLSTIPAVVSILPPPRTIAPADVPNQCQLLSVSQR